MKIKQEKQEKILVLMKLMKQLTLKENPVGDVLMVKASEADDNRLVG